MRWRVSGWRAAATVTVVPRATLRLEKTGGVVVAFTVDDPPSLTMRRLELLATTAVRWEASDSSFHAEFPPDAGSYTNTGVTTATGEDSMGATMDATVSRRSGQTVVRIRVRPHETSEDAVLPPREAHRADLRDALGELLAERTIPTVSPGPHSVFFWALSTLTIFGAGEEFLLRLRENRFRRPIFDRLVPSWAAHHPTRRFAVHFAAAILLLAAVLVAVATG